MTWTVYRWDDSGAPALSATSNSLHNVLRGCLCTGYGEKSAAGWTEDNYATDKSIYVNAGTGHGISVIHAANSSNATVVGVEFGDNYGPYFPTTTQAASGLYWYVSATTDATLRPWIILADEKRFYLWVGYNLTTAGALSASTTLQQLHFAGDILSMKGSDAYHFAVIGATTNGATQGPLGSFQSTIGGTLATGHYLCRSHTQAPGSVQFGKVSDYGASVSTSSGNVTSWAYPDPVSNGMALSQARCFESNIWGPRGLLPGLWFVNHNMPGNNGDTFNGTAGGPLAGKSFILLDACSSGARVRFALETSDTLGV